jgi:4-amino-4-deoxy-L-arabinose transferase-like glycosyltransferase
MMHASAHAARPRKVLPVWQRAWFQALVVLVVAGCIYWPMLGSSGFAFSEAQRVLPGWEMAKNGDWLMPRLFEQPYLRKPPGMPWAVAAMSKVLGESEFSARAVSALATTLAGLVSMAFAHRWFRKGWGMFAGCAYLLTPLYWYPGRSAEIEAPHNLFALSAMLLVLDLLIYRSRTWWLAAALAVSLAGMAVVKGPSGLPAVLGAIAGACVMMRSARVLLSPRLVSALAVAGAMIAYVAWRVLQRAAELPEPPVLQSAARFLYKPGHLPQVFLLPLSSLLAVLPWSLSLIGALPASIQEDYHDRLGRGAAYAVLIALLIYTVIGVSNNRYTMPATTILPVVSAYVGWRLSIAWIPVWLVGVSKSFVVRRPWIYLTALFIGSLLYVPYTEHRRAVRTSGQKVGYDLARTLPDGAEVWGDALLDNRGEVAYYAQRRAAEMGRTLRIRWVPANKNGQGDCPIPPPGVFLVLLESGQDATEVQVQELERYRAAGLLGGLEEVFDGAAHKFVFRVYRVLPTDRLVRM